MSKFFTPVAKKGLWRPLWMSGLLSLVLAFSAKAQQSSFEQTVTVRPKPLVSMVETEVCVNDSVTLLFTGIEPFILHYTPTNLGLPDTFGTGGGITGYPLTLLSGPDTNGVKQYSARVKAGQAGTFTFALTFFSDSTCNGLTTPPQTHTIKVRELPAIAMLTPGTFCNGERYWGYTLGSYRNEYTWTNVGDFVGLTASGTGNIPPFTIMDTTRQTITARYAITAKHVYDQVACYAYDTLFISANPAAQVDTLFDVAVCNHQELKVNFSGDADHFLWSKISGDNIPGLLNNGRDSIFVASVTNNGNSALSAVYEVIPEYNYPIGGICPGIRATLTVTVYPDVYMTSSHDTVLINSGATFSYTATTNISNVSHAWSDSITTGATISKTLTNTATATDIEYYTYYDTITAGSCFTIDSIVVGVVPNVQILVANHYLCADESVNDTYTINGTGFDAVITTSATIIDTIYTLTGVTNALVSGSLDTTVFNYGVTNVQVTFTTVSGAQFNANFTVTVNALPAMTLSNETYCAGERVNEHVFGTGIPTYSWTSAPAYIGANETGTGVMPTFIAINTTLSPIIDTFYVTATIVNPYVICSATDTFAITVNPLPTVNQVNDTLICSSTPLTIAFTGNRNYNTYNWRRISGYAITAASTGSGNISATPVNTSGLPVSAVYEVTPVSAEGCIGAPVTFTITVNPALQVTPLADRNYCANATAPAVTFNGNVAAVAYTWAMTAGDTIPGLPASGSGNMPAFWVSDTIATVHTATYAVTMTYTNNNVRCTATDTFDITVYPIPTVTAPIADFVLCNGDTLPLQFTGNADRFTWHKIGGDIISMIPANGVGDTIIKNVTNTGNQPLTALYEVVPMWNSATTFCGGIPFTFQITVNPNIVMTSAHTATITSGDMLSYTATTNAIGATVTWTSIATYVSGSAGAGNHPVINETLINSTNTPQIITYYFTFDINNCTLFDSLTVLVNPLIGFTPTPDQDICADPNSNGYTVPNTQWDIVVADLGAIDTVYYVLTGVTTLNQGNTLQNVTFNYGITTVTWTAVDTFGTTATYSFKVTVYMLPVLTLHDETYCAGTTIPAHIFGTGVTVYTWTRGGDNIGLAYNNGAGIIPAFTATAAGVDTFYVSAVNTNPAINCAVHDTLVITINDLPTVNAVADTALCSNTNLNIAFSGSAISGTVYHYQLISGNAIQGLPVSGDSILTGTAINTTVIPLTAVYRVTPEANGCTGTPVNFRITVNPAVQINATADVNLCTGTAAPAIHFSGNVNGAACTWTRISATTINGLPLSGSGNMPAFFATNSTTAALTATYAVLMTYTNEGVSCTAADTFDITVYPMPTVTYPNADTTLCNGELLNITFNGAADTYSWRKLSGNIITGLPANGTGNINIAALHNSGNTPLTALYEVTPAYSFAAGICQGVPHTFMITVNPTPALTSHTAGDTICSGGLFTYTATSNVAGAAFEWGRAAIADINSGAAGSGYSATIAETLTNSSTAAVTVLYQYTVAINGCISDSASSLVSVVVLPATEAAFAARYNVCANEPEVILAYTSTFTNLTYRLLFDIEAQDAGFMSVAVPAVLPADGIHVAMPAGVAAGNYHATIVIDSKGCQTSYTVTIHVIPLPTIVSQPKSLAMLCPGQSQLELSVAATGENLSYQWYLNGAEISGATGTTYSVLYDSTLAGTYYVMVMAECDTLISGSVTVTTNNIIVKEKWTDVLYVDNTGHQFTGYQWYKDGKPVVVDGQSQYYAERPYLQGTYRVRIKLADDTYLESCDYTYDNSRKLFDNLYPNPAEAGMDITVELYSELSALSNSTYELYDVLGRRLMVQPFTGNSFTVKAPAASGSYHLRIINNEAGVINKRFIVK